jgi:ABC-type nitrate/sulfonate/bicarbonate transport system permease component
MAMLLGVWQVLGLTVFSKAGTIPPPTDIVSQMRADGFSFYWDNTVTTFSAAAQGWLYGNALAVFLALLVLVVGIFERPVLQLGITSYCLPIVAVGTIVRIVFGVDAPRLILAAMAVFFTTLVGALVGLRSADPTSIDVVHAYGGGSMKKLTKVRFRASLPSLFAGLRIAAPAAILGAILGEYVGADDGLGVAMVASQQLFIVPRTWALALVATLVAGVAYGVTALVGRLLTPWAPRDSA